MTSSGIKAIKWRTWVAKCTNIQKLVLMQLQGCEIHRGYIEMNDWALPPGNQHWPSSRRPSSQSQDKPFLDKWASSAALWGTRHGAGEALDRYFGMQIPSVSSGFAAQLAGEGIDDFEGKQAGPLGYNQILKLKNDYISWKNLNWKRLQYQVKDNIYEFRQAIQPGQARSFFAEISPKTYAKEILWGNNIKPFQELLSGSKQNLFMNLGYIAGVCFAGASIVKTGIEHYRYWKQRENGSIASQWHTAYETGKALCQKAIQSFGSWEAAGIGMAIGRALIPVGAFPIGGILVGALFATTAYKAIGKLFPSLANPAPSKS
jgi:hypothetical protein